MFQVGHGDIHQRHPDTHTTRIQKDLNDLKSVINMLETINWINLFGIGDTDLLSLSTGCVARQDITDDIIRAHDVGEKAYIEFEQ